MRWIWNTGVWLSSAMEVSWSKGARDRTGASRSGIIAQGRTPPAPAQAQLQQRHEAAALVERDQVVAAADVGVADEDLRHGAPAGELHHGVALGGVQVDADLLDLRRRRAA